MNNFINLDSETLMNNFINSKTINKNNNKDPDDNAKLEIYNFYDESDISERRYEKFFLELLLKVSI